MPFYVAFRVINNGKADVEVSWMESTEQKDITIPGKSSRDYETFLYGSGKDKPALVLKAYSGRRRVLLDNKYSYVLRGKRIQDKKMIYVNADGKFEDPRINNKKLCLVR